MSIIHPSLATTSKRIFKVPQFLTGLVVLSIFSVGFALLYILAFAIAGILWIPSLGWSAEYYKYHKTIWNKVDKYASDKLAPFFWGKLYIETFSRVAHSCLEVASGVRNEHS